MRHQSSVSAYYETRNISDVTKDILHAKELLGGHMENNPSDPNLLLVRNLGFAYLSHPYCRTSVHIEHVYETPSIDDQVAGEGVKERIIKTVKDELRIPTDGKDRYLFLDTYTTHAKKPFIPIISLFQKVPYVEEPLRNAARDSILRLVVPEHYVELNLYHSNDKAKIETMGRLLLELPHQPESQYRDDSSDDKAVRLQ